jgi:hypothetical protein
MARGGAGRGQGRKPLPLYERKVKKSVTLSLTAIEAVQERAFPDEEFSTALDRILNALPVLSALASGPPSTG